MAKKKVTKEIISVTTEEITRETTVYIGKSLPILPTNTVFKGGKLPPYVEELVAKDETIAGLIVPVSQLQEARKNMHVKGHILNYYFNKQTTIKEV